MMPVWWIGAGSRIVAVNFQTFRQVIKQLNYWYKCFSITYCACIILDMLFLGRLAYYLCFGKREVYICYKFIYKQNAFSICCFFFFYYFFFSRHVTMFYIPHLYCIFIIKHHIKMFLKTFYFPQIVLSLMGWEKVITGGRCYTMFDAVVEKLGTLVLKTMKIPQLNDVEYNLF